MNWVASKFSISTLLSMIIHVIYIGHNTMLIKCNNAYVYQCIYHKSKGNITENIPVYNNVTFQEMSK